jgi:hypothetical protein
MLQSFMTNVMSSRKLCSHAQAEKQQIKCLKTAHWQAAVHAAATNHLVSPLRGCQPV